LSHRVDRKRAWIVRGTNGRGPGAEATRDEAKLVRVKDRAAAFAQIVADARGSQYALPPAPN